MKVFICIIATLLLLLSCNNKISIENNYAQVTHTSLFPSIVTDGNLKNISNGVFLNKNTILTTAHSVGTTKDMYLINSQYKAQLYKKYSEQDIALLTTNRIDNKKILSFGKELQNLDTIFILQANGIITGKIHSVLDDIYLTNIKFTPGDSGSGVFNEKMELIGIVGAYDREKNKGIIYKIKAKNLDF